MRKKCWNVTKCCTWRHVKVILNANKKIKVSQTYYFQFLLIADIIITGTQWMKLKSYKCDGHGKKRKKRKLPFKSADQKTL